MSDTTTTPTPPINLGIDDLREVLGMNRKKVTYGEYTRNRNKNRPKLRRESYQNDARIEPDSLSIAEISLLNRITHSGRYIDRKVEVVINTDSAEEVVYIRWHNRTADQRSDLKGLAPSFENILQQIVTAQEAEKATAVAKKEEKEATRRHFGDNKAYRDAKEHAEAEA